ncbi:hypothetical protein [Synechococcus sp. BIOS-E4-1]|uniref:hypothetical protein n=1 Tax=Synechococcus sp. BIOS-E4-1 TaxID=1400864 RepID=UPI001CA390AF|nr:hypothetical protein [Synechococcus sp. BIOS-E4-1]
MSAVERLAEQEAGARFIDEQDRDALLAYQQREDDIFNLFPGDRPDELRSVIGPGLEDHTYQAPGVYSRRVSMETPAAELSPAEARTKLQAIDAIRGQIIKGAMLTGGAASAAGLINALQGEGLVGSAITPAALGLLAAGAGVGAGAIAHRTSRLPSRRYVERIGQLEDRFGPEKVVSKIGLLDNAIEKQAMENALMSGGLTSAGVSTLGLINAMANSPDRDIEMYPFP